MKTLNIVKRNLQISLNMKGSSVILILAPLLLIALIGIALQDTSLKNVQAGIYSETNFDDELSQSIKEKINENSIKTIENKNLETCKQNVKNGDTELCIELKEPHKNEIGQQNQNIILHVDFSKQRTVWTIIGKVQGIIESESEKERDILINDVKKNSKDALTEIEKQEEELEKIKNRIISIKTETLPQLNQKIEGISKTQQEIRNKLFEIETTLNSLESYLLQIGGQTTHINSIQSTIDDIRILTYSQTTSLNSNTKEIENEINKILNEIENLENSMSETKKRLKDVNEMDFDSIMNPIKTSYKSVLDSQKGEISKDLKFLDYLFPSFLVFFILFNSIIFSASIRLRERKSNAHLRNSLSKYKSRHFIIGDFITSVLLISLQSLAILFIASFFLNVNLLTNTTSLLLIVISSVSLFTIIGLTIGSIFDSQESVIISSISLSLLLFIFSSIVTPTETLPASIASIVTLMPLTLFETKMRICMIFENQLHFNPIEIISLLTTSAILIMTTILFTKKKKEKNL